MLLTIHVQSATTLNGKEIGSSGGKEMVRNKMNEKRIFQ